MRIKFNGLIERRQKGCGKCGKRSSKMSFVVSRMYILPSGKTITFRVGRTEEVSTSDGAFLLEYRYTDADGSIKPVFEEVG